MLQMNEWDGDHVVLVGMNTGVVKAYSMEMLEVDENYDLAWPRIAEGNSKYADRVDSACLGIRNRGSSPRRC
jgi:hypothetical protein